MTVLSSELHWTGSTGSVTRNPLEETYTSVYRVHTDDPLDQSRTVLLWFAANVVNLSDAYEYANDGLPTDTRKAARAERLQADRELAGSTVWLVQVDYRTPDDEEGEDDDGNATLDPLDFRPRISTSSAQYTKPVQRSKYYGGYHGAAHGALAPPLGQYWPCVNSALVPFSPAPEMDDARFLIHIERNFLTFDADQADSWMNTVNSAAFVLRGWKFVKTVPRHAARVREFRGSLRRQNGIDFWELSTTLDVKRETWREPIVDQGVHARAGAGDPDGEGGFFTDDPDSHPAKAGVPKLRRLADLEGRPIADPVLLDGDGQPLDLDKRPFAPVLGIWLHYEEQDLRQFPMLQGLT